MSNFSNTNQNTTIIPPISGTTRLICLLGSPVAHSLSPAMHNLAFSKLALDLRYLAFDVTPCTLKQVIEGLKCMQVVGFNLTMPLKECILPYCDELSLAAKLGNSVNTVCIENGKLIGHTTDGVGFMRACEQRNIALKNETMTLLGAGGAAKAILVQAALDGVKKINVFNRKNKTFDQMLSLISQLRNTCDCEVSLHDYEDNHILQQAISQSKVLVNGTSVGMEPNTTACILDDFSSLHKDLFVYDVIYHPKETRLLKEAKARGCETDNGLSMLIYQGSAAFELWTKHKMPIDLVQELLLQN